MLSKMRVVQIMFMLVVLLLLFFWRSFDTLQSVAKLPTQEKSIESKANVNLLRCDYKTACEFVTPQGTFLLSIKELPIKAEQWIDFELFSPLENAQIKSAKMVGKTMFMGKIPVTFVPADKQHFTARTLVGSCVNEQMIWSLVISVALADSVEELVFDFMVEH